MVRRDILARSRGSFGGALWTFLNPLLLMATYFFVFGVVLQTKFGEDTSRTGYVLYFLAGMLPWLPFSEAVGRSPYVVIEHRNFVKKLVFPLETLPVNLVISGAVTEVFALVIFVVGLLAARGSVPVERPVAAGVDRAAASAGRGVVLVSFRSGSFRARPGPDHRLPAHAVVFPDADLLSGVAEYSARRGENLELEPDSGAGARVSRDFSGRPRAGVGPLAALWIGSGIVAVLGHAWFHRLRRSFADVI